MRWRFSRLGKVTLIVLAVLLSARLVLPYFITKYVNRVLNELEGYRGTIDDVDVHLIRGAYQIQGLKIFKAGHNEMPFVDIPLSDLSIEWSALLNGAIVGEVKFDKPILNFISNKKQNGEGQSGKEVDWTIPIKRLMPVDINRLTISDGKITFFDFSTKPQVNLSLIHVQMDALNLNNAKDNPEALPSRIYLQAQSIGNGQLNLVMKANVLKTIPDIDMDLRFEKVNLKALNDFFGAYAHIDVEKGEFNLYSELAVLDGNVNGYVKPLFTDLKVVDWKKDIEQPGELVWESIVGALENLFKNQRKNQFATKVPLKGHIAKVNTSFLPTVWGIFSNAFVKAFDNNTDGSISIASAAPKSSPGPALADTKKNKKELRKEKRKERKETKKRQREERRAKLDDKKKAKVNS
jgi:hypothetical protein